MGDGAASASFRAFSAKSTNCCDSFRRFLTSKNFCEEAQMGGGLGAAVARLRPSHAPWLCPAICPTSGWSPLFCQSPRPLALPAGSPKKLSQRGGHASAWVCGDLPWVVLEDRQLALHGPLGFQDCARAAFIREAQARHPLPGWGQVSCGLPRLPSPRRSRQRSRLG